MSYAPTGYRPHQGMPPFDEDGQPLSFFEFWPMWLFYAPFIPLMLYLFLRYRSVTLPTLANPAFPAGGLVGESKSVILNQISKNCSELIPPFIAWEKPQNIALERIYAGLDAKLAVANLALPFVAKPDVGCRGAGVRLLRTQQDLRAYVDDFPTGETIIFQQLVDVEGEAGIFYYRFPGQSKGKIFSITLKYFPYVYGDGKMTLEQLIAADPRAGQLQHIYRDRHRDTLDAIPDAGQPIRIAFAGSHSRGAIFRDGTQYATPAMLARFDAIADVVPGFHFGRFDIRFESLEAVQQGGPFKIIELNGAGAEATNIWDRKTSIFSAWAQLAKQYRLLFALGAQNRRAGYRPTSLQTLYGMYQNEKRLVALYPASN